MSNYARGNYYERRVAVRLRHNGYYVWQSRGSRGVADLIAVKVGEVVLVQVKGGAKKLSHGEWNGLYQLADLIGAVPLVADVPRRGAVRLRRITGKHVERARYWPCVDWTPDTLDAEVERLRRAGEL